MCFGFLLWVFKVHVSWCFSNFGMVLGIFSGIYENCLRAEKDFRGHLGSWESTLIFAVESLYILFLLILFWKMGLIGELFKY